jgi:hypothetical protein
MLHCSLSCRGTAWHAAHGSESGPKQSYQYTLYRRADFRWRLARTDDIQLHTLAHDAAYTRQNSAPSMFAMLQAQCRAVLTVQELTQNADRIVRSWARARVYLVPRTELRTVESTS